MRLVTSPARLLRLFLSKRIFESRRGISLDFGDTSQLWFFIVYRRSRADLPTFYFFANIPYKH